MVKSIILKIFYTSREVVTCQKNFIFKVTIIRTRSVIYRVYRYTVYKSHDPWYTVHVYHNFSSYTNTLGLTINSPDNIQVLKKVKSVNEITSIFQLQQKETGYVNIKFGIKGHITSTPQFMKTTACDGLAEIALYIWTENDAMKTLFNENKSKRGHFLGHKCRLSKGKQGKVLSIENYSSIQFIENEEDLNSDEMKNIDMMYIY